MQSSTPQSANVSINAVAPFMLGLSFWLQAPAKFVRGKADYHSIKGRVGKCQRVGELALSKEQREYVAHIVDLLQAIGPVKSKFMFGGFGLFMEGLMFGLIADSELYLKVDAQNLQNFEDLGLQAFSYDKSGKEFKMSYFQAPEEAMEDSELLSVRASNAYGAAMRAAAKKGKRAKTKK
jgi:DNA transformation protein